MEKSKSIKRTREKVKENAAIRWQSYLKNGFIGGIF